MTTDPLAEVLAEHEYAFMHDNGVTRCTCAEVFLSIRAHLVHQADAVRAFLVEHVAKPEVVEAVAWSVAQADVATGTYDDDARAALAALLETLGGELNE